MDQAAHVGIDRVKRRLLPDVGKTIAFPAFPDFRWRFGTTVGIKKENSVIARK